MTNVTIAITVAPRSVEELAEFVDFIEEYNRRNNPMNFDDPKTFGELLYESANQ